MRRPSRRPLAPMVFGYLIPVLIVCVGLTAYSIGRYARKNHPEVFQRQHRIIYPYASLVLSVVFALLGIADEQDFNSGLTLAAAAFFGTSFVYSIRRDPTDENRFGMMQLMLFVTLFAIGLGVRAAIH